MMEGSSDKRDMGVLPFLLHSLSLSSSTLERLRGAWASLTAHMECRTKSILPHCFLSGNGKRSSPPTSFFMIL